MMGFVKIFVPGTSYVTCDELAQHVEESKREYDITAKTTDGNLNESEARDLLRKRKFLLLDARRRDEFCVSRIFSLQSEFYFTILLLFDFEDIYNATNVHSTFTHGKDDIKELKERLDQV